MSTAPEQIAANRSFGGWHRRFRHRSAALGCDMVFAIYLPPQAAAGPVPVLYWLSGLTCTDENFMQKAGAQRLAA
ncbi:MAG: alpha/beta hydrolase-fold protein, partial [Proteobacteria bacterium]|nr:alpha/beta hydrolase-fold protein [Pseudomonadota bacterium]